MIVKVQLSQFDSEGRKMMLIYDKTRKHRLETEVDPEMLKRMGQDQKKFFHAEIVPHPKNWLNGEQIFQIGEQAPWQNW